MQELKDLLPILTAIIVVAFDWGVLYQKIKGFITKEFFNRELIKLKETIEKQMNDKLKNHCPNTLPLRNIDLKVQRLEEWKEEHQHFADIQTGNVKLGLQEIRINLKNICDHLGVDYHNGNSNNT